MSEDEAMITAWHWQTGRFIGVDDLASQKQRALPLLKVRNVLRALVQYLQDSAICILSIKCHTRSMAHA